MYFKRKRAFIADGRFYQDNHTASLERLEKEIMLLRKSLGEPLPGYALACAQEFPHRLSDVANPWKGGQVALARELIAGLARGNTDN